MTQDSEIDREVGSVVRDALGRDAVHKIMIARGHDSTDEGVLTIRVVLRQGRVDPMVGSGLARLIRNRLIRLDEQRFPLVSFLSMADAKGLKAEAA
jgi:hypothetical protein